MGNSSIRQGMNSMFRIVAAGKEGVVVPHKEKGDVRIFFLDPGEEIRKDCKICDKKGFWNSFCVSVVKAEVTSRLIKGVELSRWKVSITIFCHKMLLARIKFGFMLALRDFSRINNLKSS